MIVIDSHAHLWRRERTPEPWIDPHTMSAIDRDFWIDDLESSQRMADIAGSIVVQSAPLLQETLDLLCVADGRIIRGVVGWVDLQGDVESQLDHLRTAPGGEFLVGIRHLAHQDPDPRWLERQIAYPTDLVFDLVVNADQLRSAIVAVDNHPDTTFVLDHLGKPPIGGDHGAWTADVTELAARPNVVAKLSGLTMQADWRFWSVADVRAVVDTGLEVFGADRLLFGTDWPLVDLSGGVERWLSATREILAGLSPDEADAVYRRNTLEIYCGTHDA